VRTGLTHDVYLTIAGTNAPVVGSDEAVLEVFRKPLILWLWIGGLMMAVGTVLSAFPGRRRRNPLDAVSAHLPDPLEPRAEPASADV
jgi:cytochrome c-type biogenesis protein CcmF